MGFRVQGLGFGGMGFWFRVWGLGLRAQSCQGSSSRLVVLGLRVQVWGFRI